VRQVGRKPKLSVGDVVMLRALFKAGHTKTELARRYHLANKTVIQYLRGDHKNREIASICCGSVEAWQ
jgi:predicted transcriptional regulator